MLLMAENRLQTKYGEFVESLFFDGKDQAIAIVKGDIRGKDNILTRVHSHCISAHIFNGVGCDCQIQMDFAQRIISEKQSGIIIWLNQEGRSNGHYAKMLADKFKDEGYSQEEAYQKAGFCGDQREYSLACKILDYFQIRNITLITNSNKKISYLKNWGVNIYNVINTPKINEK